MTSTTSARPYEPRCGYSTLQVRKEYLLQKGFDDEESERISSSLVADPSPSSPLYFWQLYSLIGHQPILEIVTDFYRRVYQDPEDWFRRAFSAIGSKEHHIQAQVAYWVDAMGGGRVYHGGNYRLEFHHTHNASKVMNAKGAKRWMYHMRKALQSYDFSVHDDPRVLPCIVDFLRTKMQSYAYEHGWKFDEGDFDFV